MNNKTENKSTNNIDSVDQIRNILFGEQINIIEKRFTQLENNINKTIHALEEKVERNTKELHSKIDKSQLDLQEDISVLSQQQSEDLSKVHTTINNKIIETESDLINQIQSGLQKLDHKASHRNELSQLLKDMADKLSD